MFIRVLSKLDEWLAATTLLAMLTIGALAILFRATGGPVLQWADELNRMLMIWLTLLGALIATKENSHIRFEDGIFERMPAIWQIILGTALDILSVLFLLYFAWYGYVLASAFSNQMLIALRSVSISWFYMSVPIVCTLMAILVTARRLRQLALLWRASA